MAWVEGGERDGNASDEIRGTRVPRVTQGQLDSRPFKRDYVQRPSSLVLSLSLSRYFLFSLFLRACRKRRVFFRFSKDFSVVLFLYYCYRVVNGIIFSFWKEEG